MNFARLSCVVLAFVVMTPNTMIANRQGVADIAGRYSVEGHDPNGQSYGGTLDLARDGEAWSFHWDFGNGTAIGVGLLDGDVLAVVCQFNTGGICLSIYRIVRDAQHLRLVGHWTIPGTVGVFDETLTRDPNAVPPTSGQRVQQAMVWPIWWGR